MKNRKIGKRILIPFIALALVIAELYIPQIIHASTISENEFASKIASLKSIYRDREYWNGYNSVGYDGTGNVKCKCSVSCSGSCSCDCGKFYLNGIKYGGQCYGFANKMAYLIFGSIPDYSGSSWTKSTSVSAYYAGDYVRINNDRHSIFITKVSGSTVTYVDCNNAGPCMVKWDRTISISDLKAKTTYVRHLPGNTLTGGGDINPQPANLTPDSRFSGYTPFNAYTIATGNISVCDENGTTLSGRYITGSTDLCVVEEVYTNGLCRVKYPSSASSSGYFTAYTQISNFISNPAPSGWTANKSYTAYRRADMSQTIGSVDPGDSCLKVSQSGSNIQVIYPCPAGHKMGWVRDEVTPDANPNWRTPVKAYTISTGHVSVYSSPGGSIESGRYIDGATDLCTIEEIYNNGWCRVSYPISSGTRTAYVPMSEFTPSSSTNNWTATGSSPAYRRSSGGETIGTLDEGDDCVKVAEENGRTQIEYPVTGTNYYKLGWIDTPSNSPIFAWDSLKGGIYSLEVSGWTFDKDEVNTALKVLVYIDDKFVGTLDANRERVDVNNVYGCGNNHGFYGKFNVSGAGKKKVRLVAQNIGGGADTDMGTREVDVKGDITPPSITDVKVIDIDSTGYTVTCKVTDENGIEKVQFPTWTLANGKDDLFENWSDNSAASGRKEGDYYTYRVEIAAHNYEVGEYATHIYAYDIYGNVKDVVCNAEVPVAVEAVFLEKSLITMASINEEKELVANILPSGASDQSLSWKSSNTDVVTVKDGIIKAVGVGKATIIVTSNNGCTDSCDVEVTLSKQETPPPVTVTPYVPTIPSATPVDIALEGKLNVNFSNEKVYSGDVFEVELGVKDNPGFSTLKAILSYDESVLELVELKNSGYLESMMQAVPQNGKCSILWDDSNDCKGDEVLAIAVFRVRKENQKINTEIGFDFGNDSYNWDEKVVSWKDAERINISIKNNNSTVGSELTDIPTQRPASPTDTSTGMPTETPTQVPIETPIDEIVTPEPTVAPRIENRIVLSGGSFWDSLIKVITFGLYDPDITVSIESTLGGKATIYYYVDRTGSNKVLNSEELDNISEWKKYKGTFALEEGKAVVYAKIVYEEKVYYVSSDGMNLVNDEKETAIPTIKPTPPKITKPTIDASTEETIKAPTHLDGINHVEKNSELEKTPISKAKMLRLSSVKCKRNSKYITGKVSVKGALISIKVGNKAFRKAIVKGKKFTFKTAKLKKMVKVTIKVTKTGYQQMKKVYKVK